MRLNGSGKLAWRGRPDSPSNPTCDRPALLWIGPFTTYGVGFVQGQLSLSPIPPSTVVVAFGDAARWRGDAGSLSQRNDPYSGRPTSVRHVLHAARDRRARVRQAPLAVRVEQHRAVRRRKREEHVWLFVVPEERRRAALARAQV